MDNIWERDMDSIDKFREKFPIYNVHEAGRFLTFENAKMKPFNHNMRSKFMAELAMMRNLGEVNLGKLMKKKGRLFNLYERLIKLVDIEFRNFVSEDMLVSIVNEHPELLKAQDISRIVERYGKVRIGIRAQKYIDEFTKQTGFGNPNHVMVHISMLALICEKSEYKYPDKLTNVFVDITDYLQNGNNTPEEANYTAEHGFYIWEAITKEELYIDIDEKVNLTSYDKVDTSVPDEIILDTEDLIKPLGFISESHAVSEDVWKKVTELHENAQHAFLHKAHKEFGSFPIRDLNGKERDFAKLSDFDAAMLTQL